MIGNSCFSVKLLIKTNLEPSLFTATSCRLIADGHDPVVVEIFVDPYFVTTFPAQTDNQYMTTLTGHHPRKLPAAHLHRFQ